MKPFIKGTKTDSNVEHISVNEGHAQHDEYLAIVREIAHKNGSIMPCDEIYRVCLEIYNYIEDCADAEEVDEQIRQYTECMSYFQTWQLAAILKDELVDCSESEGIEIELDLKNSNLSNFMQQHLYWYFRAIAGAMFQLIEAQRQSEVVESDDLNMEGY